MDSARTDSLLTASTNAEASTAPASTQQSTSLPQPEPQPRSPPSRSPSATSTATERPPLQLHHAPSYPPKPPSVDSNFSSVQGKTAGTPPDQEDVADHLDQTVSSIWEESVYEKTQPIPTSSAPATSAPEPPPSAPSHRPDWMTDDLDESWPEEEAAAAQPTPRSSHAVQTNNATTGVQSEPAQHGRSQPLVRPTPIPDPLATPSTSSRPPNLVALSTALPDPAFSAARRQARRALLKGRSSGLPTPRGPTGIDALQAGPSTPSHRIPSHQGRLSRLRQIDADDEEGDSTIWSQSESESESDSASAGSAPDDFKSARGSLAENSRITNVQTAQQPGGGLQQQTHSPSTVSDASGAKGTFIHKADVSSLPPILRPAWQSPAKGNNDPNRKGVTALGGDMFTPMRLQTMFKTPTPPEKPMQNIMSAVAPAVNPFSARDAPTSNDKVKPAEGETGLVPAASSNHDHVDAVTPSAPQLSDSRPLEAQPSMGTAVPSTAFTFQSPHASVQAAVQVSRGMVPSQSLQNMQSLHPNGLHTTTLARPASAAADLGLHSPAVAGSAANLVSGPPTPHTPMRLFKFNYDDAVTRAKLELMVNERTPAAAQQPQRPADYERERKRLRLDVKPRKVLTGDLMSMQALSDQASSKPSNEAQVEPKGLNGSGGPVSDRQPVVDYVKESTDFMNALQDAVRVHTTSPEWATEEEESSGNGAENGDQVSFHQGKADTSSAVSASSPARPRRSHRTSHGPRLSHQQNNIREDVVPSAVEHASPQRLSSRRLPPDSSFITESSSNDVPMSSTLKSRASLSRRIAAQVKAGESPRKLLRRISAAALAEEEVQQEFDGQETQAGKLWKPVKLTEDAIAYRDQQIRQLEERIARRRQLYTPAKPGNAAKRIASDEEPRTVQKPQMITLHEPTLDAIAGQRQHGQSDSDDESDADESVIAAGLGMQPDGATRRFQDGIVLYDSERIPDPPLADPTRTLRNVASAIELRNRETDRTSLARAASLLALPTQPLAAGTSAEIVDAAVKRGDRTASSNTLVDPSSARTVSGDAGSQLTISDLGGKGATITRTGSLFNISQIPEQEIESLGRGKLRFNKELQRWEKVRGSRSSHEDLRSAAGSRNDAIERMSTSKTPIPPIPEASVELSDNQDVFSESADHQRSRAQGDTRTNSFQQRFRNLSSNNLNAADGQLSDSSDPFRDFESFGQSSHAHASMSDAVDGGDESTPRPIKSQMFVSSREPHQQRGIIADRQSSMQPAVEPVSVQQAGPERNLAVSISPATLPSNVQPKTISPSGLGPRTLPTNTVPRSSSSLRNVVTYSPDSTLSSRRSSVGQHAVEERNELESPMHDKLKGNFQIADEGRPRESAEDAFATPARRLAHRHLGTPTPRGSDPSMSTPKSILKQPAVFRNGAPTRSDTASHNASDVRAAGAGTPNRTISFADPPSTARPRDLGFAPSSRFKSTPQRGQATTGMNGEVNNADSEDGRTQAISSALKMLADLTLGEDTAVLGSAAPTPSKMRDLNANRSHWSYHTLRRPRKTRRGDLGEDDHSWHGDEETYDELHGYPDMTLLTDASFNFAHDKVLEAITDVEPWEPGWDELQAVDLSRRRLESCVRLKEFLPVLEEVDLQGNQLSYLTGIPGSVRVLNVGQNRLTSMASFGHLLHLEELDISGNQIDSLSHLSCLKHLHTLKADANAITSLNGIDKIRSLVHVSLSGNHLKGVNLAATQWAGLETLDVSHNQLISIRGLSLMHRLKSLNVDHNDLNMVDLSPAMPKLRVLRVSGNAHLQTLDVSPAKRLRTLYADYCDLERIANLDQLEHLDNLSMRQQAEAAIAWPADQLRDVRRLFLSGNAFPQGISTTSNVANMRKPIVPAFAAQPSLVQPLRFLNLVYLELSACQLMRLPEDLAEVAPNLRSLNLDHNLISTLPSLAGMQRLKRLSLVGCRVKKSKSIITAVRELGELQVLDCRTNPCTLGLYAPLVAPSALPTQRDEEASANMDALAASWLPPVPNAQIVQPDLAARQQRRQAEAQREQLELLEKSHFHKRRPPLADYAVDPNATLAKDALEKETARRAGADGATYSTVFSAADKRFVRTLPKEFYERRVLHRGLLAMACPKLTWIDGLLIDEEEIDEADRLVQSHRFDRGPAA